MLKRERVDKTVMRVMLRTGQSLKVRPITPADKEKLRDLFYRLSPQTRYFRFGYMKTHVTDQELTYYTDFNPPDMYAYVALAGEGEEERIIAVGRWFLSDDDKSADIALVVEDDMQVRGVGAALLEQLAEAAHKYKIKRFIARVLPENTRVLQVFEESGFKISKRIHEGAYQMIFDLEEQEEYPKRQDYREHIARSAGVRRIFCPKSVAVIGASRDPESLGGKVIRNLLQGGFTGTVFPVNPLSPSVAGVLCYPSVNDVPGDVDLAVIVLPAPEVLEAVDQCAKKGVGGVVLLSTGFAETGPEGKERQSLLREKLLFYGMRCIGPNCLGIINTDPAVCLNATHSPVAPASGNLSISSHSGALGLALLDYIKSNNLGIAHFASIGNRVDISSNDLLEFWEEDENTAVILLYLESFGNPRKFSRIARRVSRKKPIITIAAGRNEAGARAATSRAGALAASDIALDALFRQTGVVRVNTIEEMINVAKCLARQPLPKGPRLAILTNAEGSGVLAADAATGRGLTVPELSDETRKKLSEFLPEKAVLANPVDMIAPATGEHFKKSLVVLLQDPGIDAVIIVNAPLRPREEVAAGIKEAMTTHGGDKTVLACFMMSGAGSGEIEYGPGKTVPLYVFPEDAVQALSHAYSYSRYRSLAEGQIPSFPEIDEERARKFLQSSGATIDEARRLLPETALGLFKEYGIPVVETRVARDAAEAARVSLEIGFPVVMKLRSSTVANKSDVGGIALDLQSKEEVKRAFIGMKTRIEALGRGREMEGVVLQPMLKGGEEVLIGMSQDPVFGPLVTLVMLGLGGIHVELIKDFAFSLHPLKDVDPALMLKQLKGLPLLEGWRGSAPKDTDALKEILLRFSALIEDFPEFEEIVISPLFVFDEGRGCTVVDARIACSGQGRI